AGARAAAGAWPAARSGSASRAGGPPGAAVWRQNARPDRELHRRTRSRDVVDTKSRRGSAVPLAVGRRRGAELHVDRLVEEISRGAAWAGPHRARKDSRAARLNDG